MGILPDQTPQLLLPLQLVAPVSLHPSHNASQIAELRMVVDYTSAVVWHVDDSARLVVLVKRVWVRLGYAGSGEVAGMEM